MKVAIDSDIPYIRGIVEPYAEVIYMRDDDITAERIRDCDALLVRTRTRCNEALLTGTKVRFIATATIGLDHIDQVWCKANGITVCNARGCNARGVLQWVSAVLKHIVLGDGKRPEDYTIGIVGVGSVGSLVEEYSRRWGFRVLRCDPPRKEREGGDFRTLEELAERCDILTFHTPLDASTRHLLNNDIIARLKPEAIIINASRGGVVDNRAVFHSSHRYFFDVWESEPNIDREVLARAELATNHIAGYSKQGKANATAMSVNSLARHFDLPLKDWYPKEVTPTTPLAISWEEMCAKIDRYCAISEESQRLKANPEIFETWRNSYSFREEFF